MNQLKQTIFLLLLLSVSLPVFADKTDIIILRNGDHITGEIKGLSAGKLELSTEYMDTVFIDWNNIRDIISNQGQQVEMGDGRRFYGTLNKPPVRTEEDEDKIIINTATGQEEVSAANLINMYPVGTEFWDKMDLSFTLGFNFDKSSSVGKYNFGADSKYRTTEHVTFGKLAMELTTQQSKENTSRNVLNVDHLRIRPQKRFYSVFGSAEQNDQLGIKMRALLGAGYGWVPVANNRNWFAINTGLAVNREVPLGDGDPHTNLEAVGALRYQYYRRGTPERTAEISLKVFPSLNQWGRVRADFSASADWEIINDFWIGMELYSSFDGEPESSEAAEVDYGARTTIGIKF